MDNNKSFYLMIVLTMMFIIMMWFSPVKNLTKNNQQETEVKEERRKTEENKKTELISNKEFLFENITKEEVSNKETLQYENSLFKIIFSEKDAIIRHAYLKYNFSNNNSQIDLVSPLNEKDGAMRLKFGKWENDLTLEKLTGGNDIYSYKWLDKNKIEFECNIKDKKNGTIYTIRKTYQFFEGEYFFSLDIELFNNKGEPVKFDKDENVFSIGWGPFFGLNSREKEENKTLIDVFSYFDGHTVKDIKMNDKILKGSLYTEILRKTSNSWISTNTHYFASVLFPEDKNLSFFVDYRDYKNKNYYCGIVKSSDSIKINSKMKMFLLPKSPRILSKYEEFKKDGMVIKSHLETKIMFGLGNLIERLLYYIYKVVKNYGIAIIILTIFIKLLLHPLTVKSMQSQKRLTEIQPKIKEIQEKYKDNPEALNRETMKLYQKEKINPLGGCLPMLLQMPILIAMYRLLYSMVELKGASFLWINDLTLPDAIYYFPFSLNLIFIKISSINVLPIIMVITQLLSSLIMPEYKSNKQAKMMMWFMPILFFFLFYNISSGLVLYWTVMNLLNIIQQLFNNYFKFKKVKNA